MLRTLLIVHTFVLPLYSLKASDPLFLPLELQQQIISYVFDDDTLGSLSLVSKTIREFVFDEQGLVERKKNLLQNHTIQRCANDEYSYACCYTLELHIFNKRHSALIVTNRYRKFDNVSHQSKPSKAEKHRLWIAVSKLDSQTANSTCWGYGLCDGYGYNGTPYFNAAGQPCVGRIDWEKESSVTDYVFSFSKQNNILEKKKSKKYYIDFGDGNNPQPLALLGTRFKLYSFVIMRAPVQYETPTAKVCAIHSAALSPTVKKKFHTFFTWLSRKDNRPWTEQLQLQPTNELLGWALFAAHGGYKNMYRKAVQLYWERMMWPLRSDSDNYYPLWGLEYHYRFAKNKCAVDDTKKFHDYLYEMGLKEYKDEWSFRMGKLHRYMQCMRPYNLLVCLQRYCIKIYCILHRYLSKF